MEKQSQNVRDLIYFFTHNKNLTHKQQLRRDKLLVRDCIAINKDNNEDLTVKEKEHDNVEPPVAAETNCDKKTIYISPKNLHSFLYDFNQNSVLKYTCHEIDTDDVIEEINKLCDTKRYNFKKHSSLNRKSFDVLLKNYKRDKIYLDNKFIGMLMGYIGMTKKDWSSLDIKTNWDSDDIVNWSEQNEGIIPSPSKNIAKKQKNNGFKLNSAIISNLTGERILTFRELVIYFKSLFHIRRDNSLRKILQYQNENLDIENINIKFSETEFNDNIELLTDVDKLVQAYVAILRICKDNNPEGVLDIELSYYEHDCKTYFTIGDNNHCYKKTIKNATERIGNSQKLLIKNQINGLCNLYVEADFGNNEYARIGLWTKESKPLEDEPNVTVEHLDKAEGVKYILEFDWR